MKLLSSFNLTHFQWETFLGYMCSANYKCHLLCVVKLTGLRDFSLLVPLASLACVGTTGTKLGLVLGGMDTYAADRKDL